MRIIHLANHIQLIGNGIVNMMIDLACLQAQAGHDVVVASSGGEFAELLASHGVRHVHLAQSRDPWRAPAMLLEFNRLVRRFDPDVVHAHMMTGTLLARFGVMRRRFVVIATVHNEFQRSASLMRFADRVVAVTQAVATSMAARGVPAERLSVVLNGTVGTPRLAGVPLPPSPQLRRPSITTVAGMYQRKGIHDLLRAFARVRERFPQATLYLVGNGPDRAMMEALAEELGLGDSAQFAGFVGNPKAYLAETDVFVLASHKEPGGLVLCEAREAGCAVVATRVDGNPEMVGGEASALLVPAADPEALAAAIGRLLEDDAFRADFAARGQRNLAAFSVQRVCEAYLQLYERTIDEWRPSRGARVRGATSYRGMP